MIDFRYHLVSLASVLIALAVGIVLGAGPLKEDIGNTLTTQVTQLRGEKDALRADLDAATKVSTARDQFEAELLSRMVAGELASKRVALVVLPGAETTVVDQVSAALKDSGADLAEPIVVNKSWVEGAEDKVAARTEVGNALLEDASLPPVGEDGGQSVDSVLAAALTGKVSASALRDPLTTSARRALFDGLVEADLVADSDALGKPVDGVVVIAGTVDETGDAGVAQTKSRLALAATVDRTSEGAVLTEDTTKVADQALSPLAVARDQKALSKGLSTVDAPHLAMGQVDVVLALAEQFDGGEGHYGVRADATAALPGLGR
ncbi:copper transporter [Janibacter sp. G1551]|uniref:copper transporter n=1 Tax=Janibacter sp. G1551 TaxID=3420440 RepID=UPI003D07A09E